MSTEKTDDLHQLIQSLSKTERRYFKVYFKGHAHGELSKYLDVFDVMAKMVVFDKSTLTAKVKGDITGRYYSKTKAYLSESILEAMQSFAKGGGSQTEESAAQLSAVRFLMRKNLFTQAERQLHKLKKRCIDSEDSIVLLEALQIELALNAGKWNKLESIHGEIQQNIQALQQENHVNTLHSKIIDLELQCSVRPTPEQKVIIEQYIKELESQPLEQSLMDTRRRIYSSVAVCYYMLGNPKKSYTYLETYIEEFRNKPMVYQQIRFGSLIRAMQNAMTFAFHTRDVEFYNHASSKIQEVMDSIKGFEDIKFEIYLVRKFNIISLTKDFTYFAESVTHVEENKERLKKFVPVRRMDLTFNIALGYFKTKNLRKSVEWLNSLLDDPDSEHFPATLTHTRILEILIHWKLQNSSVVLSRVRSLQRHLNKQTTSSDFEKELLHFINKITTKEQYKSFAKELQIFRTQLSTLNQATYAGIVNHYEDIISLFST